MNNQDHMFVRVTDSILMENKTIKSYVLLSSNTPFQFFRRDAILGGQRSHCFTLHQSAQLQWQYTRGYAEPLFRYIPCLKCILCLLGPETCPDGYECVDLPPDVASEAFRQYELIEHKKFPFSGLSNSFNSCYIDAVLQAMLFSKSCAYVNDVIIANRSCDHTSFISRFQKEMVKISKFIQGHGSGEYNISMLRKIMETHSSTLALSFASSDQGDASEFLSFVLQLFEPKSETATLRYTVEGGVDRIISTVPLMHVNIDQIGDDQDLGDMLHTSFIVNENKTAQYTMIAPGFFVFCINRLTMSSSSQNTTKNDKFINVPMFLKMDPSMKLVAAVVYIGRHYITFMRFSHHWVSYDDNSTQMMHMERSEFPPIIATHGVLYFYRTVTSVG